MTYVFTLLIHASPTSRPVVLPPRAWRDSRTRRGSLAVGGRGSRELGGQSRRGKGVRRPLGDRAAPSRALGAGRGLQPSGTVDLRSLFPPSRRPGTHVLFLLGAGENAAHHLSCSLACCIVQPRGCSRHGTPCWPVTVTVIVGAGTWQRAHLGLFPPHPPYGNRCFSFCFSLRIPLE